MVTGSRSPTRATCGPILRYHPPVRRRFALAAALPALVALGAMAYLADRLIRRALEEELAVRLMVAAQATAVSVPAERVVRLARGDEATRGYGYVRGRLEALARATATRIFVVRPDRTALADSSGAIVIGEPVAIQKAIEGAKSADVLAAAQKEFQEVLDKTEK